jgi:UDP-glucose:(heptosyl)LPS alpha-1,3-glucosyltransferase
MKLVLVHDKLAPAGGLENYLIELAQHLEAAGHDLTFVTSHIDPAVRSKLRGKIVRVPHWGPGGMLRLWFFDVQAGRAAAAIKADAVLGFGRTTRNDIHRAGGGCHRLYSRLLPWWKRWRPHNLIELGLERRLYTGGATRHFVANCHAVSRDLCGTYGVPPDRFTIIHTPVDSGRYQPSPDRPAHRARWCRQMGTDPATPVLLFVSMGHRRKGLDFLLNVLPRLDGVTLWIVGQPLSAHYRRMIARRGLRQRVCALPPQPSVLPYYQAADWFVHPTLYDPCANTVLQSMSCGLPGVISARDGAVEHIEDGVNGLVLSQPESCDELTAQLQRALALSPEKRTAMGQAARATMRPFTWERHLREWEALLAKVRSPAAITVD